MKILSIKKTSKFTKDLKKLPQEIIKKAFEISLKLSENPLTQDLNIRQLKGFNRIYRVVVYQDYRMIFKFDSESLYLLRIAHRKDIYKTL